MFVSTGFSALNFLTLVIKMSLSGPLGQEDTSGGNLFPALKETKKGKNALLALAAFQVILICNNQGAIVGHFGVTCPGPQHVLFPSTVLASQLLQGPPPIPAFPQGALRSF